MIEMEALQEGLGGCPWGGSPPDRTPEGQGERKWSDSSSTNGSPLWLLLPPGQ